MKKTFSFLLSVLFLLFTSCTFLGKTSGSLSVYIDGEAFSNAMRAADDSFDGEVFTATLTVTGMAPVAQNFTKKTGAVLTIGDVTADSVVDISLSLSKDNVVLYKGNRKNYVVQTGENAVKIEMTATEEMKTYKNPHITYVTGTENKIEEKIVEKGYVLTEKDLPELKLEGKVFEGWYNGEVAVKAGDVINENTTLTAKWTDVKQEPVEPVEPKDPTEPTEPTEPEVIVYPNVVLTMTMNGSPVAQGGIIYNTDINNSTLAVNYEKAEDSNANLQVIIRMKVGEEEIESSKLYMPVQLNLPSILNGKTLPDGKYSLKVYLIKDEKESENYDAFDFVVKTAGVIDAGLSAEVPEFKIISSYDENNDRYEFTLKADNGDDLTGYDFKWTVNGTVLSAKSNYLNVYSNGNTGTEFVYTRFNENNQNNVICEITNPKTGSKQTATLMFGIKK